ncbi:hypothetical protein ACQKNB_00880 [Lysinibacillus xylanilyticus]|uniref:hypothetical protein n=1 Tax=Lysinibacillus xylanilyticus TaxID=582475 RepID=UPI003D0179CD
MQIKEWEIADFTISGAHSIASDGDVYVVDNTGYHEVVVLDNDFKFKQRFKNIGERPHKVIYDDFTNAFYVIATPSIYCFKKDSEGYLYLDYQKELSFMTGGYVRSIRIIDGLMYFVSGRSKIVVTNYRDKSYSILNEYTAPDELAGMNDIAKVGNFFYLTATQNVEGDIAPMIVRTYDLSRLMSGNYEDLYNVLGFKNTPYFISVFDNKVFITEIGTESNGIYSFEIEDVNLSNIEKVFKFGAPDSESVKRRDIFPL